MKYKPGDLVKVKEKGTGKEFEGEIADVGRFGFWVLCPKGFGVTFLNPEGFGYFSMCVINQYNLTYNFPSEIIKKL